jgi:sugar transferase EpsL
MGAVPDASCERAAFTGERATDVVGAVAGLFVLAPFLLLIALAVRCSLGSPVLFRQVRSGLYGRPFEPLTFRAIPDAAAADGALRPDAGRLTRFGE